MPMINDREYDHADCELQIDQVAYEFEELTYSSPREVGEGFGNQRMPAWQTDGNCKFEGQLKVREHVWMQIRKQLIATYGWIGLAKPEITISKGRDDDNTLDTLRKCKVTDTQKGSSAGVDGAMVTIPLKPWRILEDGKAPFPEPGET